MSTIWGCRVFSLYFLAFSQTFVLLSFSSLPSLLFFSRLCPCFVYHFFLLIPLLLCHFFLEYFYLLSNFRFLLSFYSFLLMIFFYYFSARCAGQTFGISFFLFQLASSYFPLFSFSLMEATS